MMRISVQKFCAAGKLESGCHQLLFVCCLLLLVAVRLKQRNRTMRAARTNNRRDRVQHASQPYTHSAVSNRVYVGNLSYDVAWQDLKDHFKPIGHVLRADVMQEPSGRSKGCGIVEFSSSREALAAIQTLNDTELRGRLIFVREDREGRAPTGFSGPVGTPYGASAGRPAHVPSIVAGGGGGPTGVVVENLPPDYDWKDLKDSFKPAGFVVRADIITNTSTGCVGVVDFKTAQEAKYAVELLDRATVGTRSLTVRLRGTGTKEREEEREVRYEEVYPDNTDYQDVKPAQGQGQGHGQGHGLPNKLYVGQLAWSVNWQRLKDHFKQCGHVTHADVAMEPNSSRSKGFGFVEYATAEEAQRAIQELNDSMLEGRKIHVRADRKD
jgi:RNA recognition motif-containing protein